MHSSGAAREMLAIAQQYFGEPDDASPAYLVNHARKQKPRLAATLLSIYEAVGHDLSAAAKYEIEIQKTRRIEYDRLYAGLPNRTRTQIIKGDTIGRLYPDNITRFVGDLDLAVPNIRDLWAAAEYLDTQLPNAQVYGTLFTDMYPTLCFDWPSTDTYLDTDFHVDLTSTPFAGNGTTVPPRKFPKGSEAAELCVIALAEEMFQRGPTLADCLDLLVLLPRVNKSRTISSLIEMHLAPEGVTLFTDAGRVLRAAYNLSHDADLLTAASLENRRRADMAVTDPVDGIYHLRRVSSRNRGQFGVIENYKESRILRTPIGIFIGVENETISSEAWGYAINKWR